MATYVLVHGAWHGGWCWRRVVRELKTDGSDIYTPTLTGLGERAHLASDAIGLETHINDVLGVLEAEDLNDIVLVGHSYAGMVVAGVASRAADRIRRLVFLDAVVPRDGYCLYDCAGEHVKTHFEGQASGSDGWRVPATAASAQFLGLKREEDLHWVLPKLTPHPVRTFRDRVRLGAKFPAAATTYVNCIGDKPLGQPRTVQAEGIDDYHELQTGHDAMVTAAAEVAQLLRAAAGADTRS